MHTKLFFSISLLLPALAFGQITANTQWDIRTTGSDSNGGAFDGTISGAGTDFSQQNSAQVAYTDMVLGAGGTSYTSAANPPGANLVGNVIQVISGGGCTAGLFTQVTAVVAGVATITPAAGSAASTCTANLGGSLLTIAAAHAGVTAQNTINIKGPGTYALAVSLTVPNGLTGLNYSGYQATHGDEGTKPLITTSVNGLTIFANVGIGTSQIMLDNLSLSSTAGSPGNGIEATSRTWPGLLLRNCKLSGFAVGILGDNGVPFYLLGLQMFNTEITATTTAAVQLQTGAIYGSWIHDNLGDGWVSSGITANGTFGLMTITRTILANNVNAVNLTTSSATTLYAQENTIAGNSGDGIHVSGSMHPPIIGLVNNIIYGNGGFGLNILSGTLQNGPGMNQTNGYGANTSGATSGGVSTGVGSVAFTSTPFTNAAIADYSLNNTAGGGALAQNAGFPGLIGGSGSTGFPALGAIQNKSSAGGGGQKAFPIVQ